MIDVQKALGVQNMSDLVVKEIKGKFETTILTKGQIRKYERSEKEIDETSESDSKLKYICSGLMSKIVVNCRGLKKCNDGINRMEKEEERKKNLELL